MDLVSTWTLTTTSEAAWEEMIASMSRAKRTIDVLQFAVGATGPFVDVFVDVLTKKAGEGVRVRILADAIGSFLFYQSPARKRLEEAGVDVLFHAAVVPRSLRRLVPAFLRDHRKLVVVDDAEAHIGGVILEERARYWRDTSVVLRGAIVEDASALFETSWSHAKRMKPLGTLLSEDGRGPFYLAGNSYRLGDKTLYRAMVRALTTAKRRVSITTPYFALTRDLRRALLYAMDQGAEVRILLPRRSDNVWADMLGRLFYAWLLRRGVRIFHYSRAILHAKTMVIDGTWATIGSSNLDWLSIWLNYELNLVSDVPRFAAELERLFEHDLETCTEVTRSTKHWYGFFGDD